MAGDAVAPSQLLSLGFRADVPHRQQVLARGARLDEVVAVDRRVDGAFVVGHGLDDGASLGRARALGERGRPEEASVSEEGAGLCIHAHGGEVASEGSTEEPRSVALLPVVGHDAIAFIDLKGVTNTTANIPLKPAIHPSIPPKTVSFCTIRKVIELRDMSNFA